MKPHTPESILVDAHGEIRAHRTWPRPIGGERPFGDGGAVAWNNGLSRYPETESAYVMYQRTADAEVVVEELPFRPTYGNWWQERLYWTCFSVLEGWQGLASWAPGGDLRLEAPGLTGWTVLPSEEGLVIHPCDYTPARGFDRRIHSHGWVLQQGRPLLTTGLGRFGSASGRDTATDWTATAHPDADAIELTNGDGRTISLACYCPLGIAWANTSLLASTIDGELLLWEGLIEIMETSPR